MPLASFKAIGKACDCTVNDVALATVAGAVRKFLISRRVHPGEIGFRVAVPVSVRRKEEHGVMPRPAQDLPARLQPRQQVGQPAPGGFKGDSGLLLDHVLVANENRHARAVDVLPFNVHHPRAVGARAILQDPLPRCHVWQP